jgi:hypothetical protein
MHNAKSVPLGTQGIDGRHCDGMDLGDPVRTGKELPAFVSRIFDSTRAWSDGEKQQTLFSVEQKDGYTIRAASHDVHTWSSALLALSMAISISRSPSPRDR